MENFVYILRPEAFNKKLDDFERKELVDILTNEIYNLDEVTATGSVLLKHLVLKLLTGRNNVDEVDSESVRSLITEVLEKIS